MIGAVLDAERFDEHFLEPCFDVLNSVSPVFQLGHGTGTLAPAFGIPLARESERVRSTHKETVP
jgi:hypothetical protein